MHLLYLDESGSVSDLSQRYFILAGVSVFERQTHWMEQRLNAIAARFNPAAPHDIELHGSPMRSGREGWKQYPLPDRLEAMKDALALACTKHIRLFGAVIDKQALAGGDAAEHAFEKLSMRFDLFLRRLYLNYQDPQRGIILLDKSSTERRIQTLARDFKHTGHSMGQTRNYAEVPVFLDSKASRLIQFADLIAFAMFRHYQFGDSQFFDVIKGCFDTDGGVRHGLYVHGQA